MGEDFYGFIRKEFLKETRFKLKQIFVYATTMCNSRCKTCNIYKKEEKNLSLEAIETIKKFVSDRDDTIIYFEGGEFFLHPHFQKILEMAKDLDTCIVSNGQLTKKITDAVGNGFVKRISFSLDGYRDAYKRIRGIDGFNNLMTTIEAIKGKTEIHINSTISPWNTYDDLKWVKSFCDDNNFRHAIQIMYPINFFESEKIDVSKFYFDVDDLLQNSSFIKNSINYSTFADGKNH